MSYLVEKFFASDLRAVRRRALVSGWRAWWKRALWGSSRKC